MTGITGRWKFSKLESEYVTRETFLEILSLLKAIKFFSTLSVFHYKVVFIDDGEIKMETGKNEPEPDRTLEDIFKTKCRK